MRRASPCHRTRALRYRRLTMAGSPHPSHRRTGSPCTIWPKKRENTSPLLEGRRTTEQHARWSCIGCPDYDEVKLGHDVFSPILQRQAHQPPRTGNLISLLRRITREGIRARRLLVLVDSRVVSEAVSKGRWSSRKIIFLLRKFGVLVPCLRHCARISIGAHLGESSGCPFTEQADRRLVCITTEAPAPLRPQTSRQFMPLRI